MIFLSSLLIYSLSAQMQRSCHAMWQLSKLLFDARHPQQSNVKEEVRVIEKQISFLKDAPLPKKENRRLSYFLNDKMHMEG